MKTIKKSFLLKTISIMSVLGIVVGTSAIVGTNKINQTNINQLNALDGLPKASANATKTNKTAKATDISLGDYTILGITTILQSNGSSGIEAINTLKQAIVNHKEIVFESGYDQINDINDIKNISYGTLDDSINLYISLSPGAWYDENGNLMNEPSLDLRINITDFRLPTKTNISIKAAELGFSDTTVSGIRHIASNDDQLLRQKFLDNKTKIFASSFDKFTNINQIEFNGTGGVTEDTSIKVHFILKPDACFDDLGIPKDNVTFNIQIVELLKDYDVTRPFNTLGGGKYNPNNEGNVFIKDLNPEWDLNQALENISTEYIFQNKEKFFAGNLSQITNSNQINIDKKNKGEKSIKYTISLTNNSYYEATGLINAPKKFIINVNNFETKPPIANSQDNQQGVNINLALGLGLGIGIPVLIMIIVILVLVFKRRKTYTTSYGGGRY